MASRRLFDGAAAELGLLPVVGASALASGAYWVAHPDASWPGTPTGAQIAAGKLSSGSPAAYAGSEPAPGSGSGDITEATAVAGLTAGTAYRIAWVVYDADSDTYSNVVVSDVVTTLAALITGTLAAQETGADTAALSGQVLVQGALAATEAGADTAALAGSVIVAGALAASEAGADTAALAGAVIVAGALAATEAGADTSAINGSSAVTTTGSIAATEAGSDTAALTGAVLVQGLLDALEAGADTGSLAGQITVAGTVAATESGGDTSAATGAVLVAGLMSAVEGGEDTSAAVGQIIVGGSLAAAEVGSDTALIRYIPPGTGADPAEVWRYVLSNGLTAEENLVQVHAWLSELHLIHGLRAGSPLTVTEVARTAGAVSQSVAESGGSVTVERL